MQLNYQHLLLNDYRLDLLMIIIILMIDTKEFLIGGYNKIIEKMLEGIDVQIKCRLL